MPITSEESIRRRPVWLARLANLIPGIRWTHNYCAGGCGYPVTGKCRLELDRVEGVPVVVLLCSLGGDCEYRIIRDPRDGEGRHYSMVRPYLVEALREHPDAAPKELVMSFGR